MLDHMLGDGLQVAMHEQQQAEARGEHDGALRALEDGDGAKGLEEARHYLRLAVAFLRAGFGGLRFSASRLIFSSGGCGRALGSFAGILLTSLMCASIGFDPGYSAP
jgi:hypothetical protein